VLFCNGWTNAHSSPWEPGAHIDVHARCGLGPAIFGTDSAVWSQFGHSERVGLSFDSARRVIAQRLADPSTLTDGDVAATGSGGACPVGAGPAVV